MSSAAAFSTNVTNAVSVDDVTRIMYYLHSVTVSVGLNILPHGLVDFRNDAHVRLASNRLPLVMQYALEFNPKEFINKFIFLDDEGKVVNKSPGNEFRDVSVASGIVRVPQQVVVAGRRQNVTKVMFCTTSWLETFYTNPVSRVVFGTWHCAHCKGRDGRCVYADCPRKAHSQCQPYMYILPILDSMAETITRLPPFPSAPVKYPNAQECTCSGCGRQWPEGMRYRCTICHKYDLCDRCYANNLHDLSHPFLQINRPGMAPVLLHPRSLTTHNCVCGGCSRQGFEGIRFRCGVCHDFDLCHRCYAANVHDPSHAFMRIDCPRSVPLHLAPRAARLVASAPHPPPHPPWTGHHAAPIPRSDPPPSYANATCPTPFFYHDMTTAELKKYLSERDVAHEDILDRETLCRRVWETHCDYMTVAEIVAFLAVNRIPAADCRDVASRRQRAWEAFQVPRPAPPGAEPRIVGPQVTGGGFRANDLMTPTGFERGEMNGKGGTGL